METLLQTLGTVADGMRDLGDCLNRLSPEDLAHALDRLRLAASTSPRLLKLTCQDGRPVFLAPRSILRVQPCPKFPGAVPGCWVSQARTEDDTWRVLETADQVLTAMEAQVVDVAQAAKDEE